MSKVFSLSNSLCDCRACDDVERQNFLFRLSRHQRQSLKKTCLSTCLLLFPLLDIISIPNKQYHEAAMNESRIQKQHRALSGFETPAVGGDSREGLFSGWSLVFENTDKGGAKGEENAFQNQSLIHQDPLRIIHGLEQKHV